VFTHGNLFLRIYCFSDPRYFPLYLPPSTSVAQKGLSKPKLTQKEKQSAFTKKISQSGLDAKRSNFHKI